MILRTHCQTENCRRYANLNDQGFCPHCQPPPSQAIVEIPHCVCDICKHEIVELESNSIGCDICEKWFHADCAGPSQLSTLLDYIAEEKIPAIKGLVLWICPGCSDGPEKHIKLAVSKCAVVSSNITSNPDHNSDNGNKINISPQKPPKTMQEKSYGEICPNYMKSVCPFGISGKGCDSYHPKLCKQYVKYGPRGKRGCSKGDSCQFFHPKLCYKSLKPISQRICTNESCGFFHLPKTKRYALNRSAQHYSNAPQDIPSFSRSKHPLNLQSRPDVTLPASNNRDNFLLRDNIQKLIRDTIQMEMASLQKVLSTYQMVPQAPPFLPGMGHFSQPLGQQVRKPPLIMNPHLSQIPQPSQLQTQVGNSWSN